MNAERLEFETNPNQKLGELKLALESLKTRIPFEVIKNPKNPRLYEKLEKYPKVLFEWFWKMCGEKHQTKNTTEVTNALNL